MESTFFSGRYTFAFTGVTKGDYLVICGTDLDNDQVVGDADEVKGAYLSLKLPLIVEVDQDVKGLVFTADFSPSSTLPLRR